MKTAVLVVGQMLSILRLHCYSLLYSLDGDQNNLYMNSCLYKSPGLTIEFGKFGCMKRERKRLKYFIDPLHLKVLHLLFHLNSHDSPHPDSFGFQLQNSHAWNTVRPLCQKLVRLHRWVLCRRVFYLLDKSMIEKMHYTNFVNELHKINPGC